MEAQYLFVYGLLRSDINHPIADQMQSHCESQGRARIKGQLFDLGGYPGLKHHNEDIIVGELMKITGDSTGLFRLLDQFEGIAGLPTDEYVRELTTVWIEDKIVQAWVYLYNHPTFNFRRIVSGDFRDTLNN